MLLWQLAKIRLLLNLLTKTVTKLFFIILVLVNYYLLLAHFMFMLPVKTFYSVCGFVMVLFGVIL